MTVVSGDSKFGPSKWYVSGNISDGATHTTITSAIASASDNDTIFIKQGNYTEDFTITKTLRFVGFSKGNTTIKGKVTNPGFTASFINLSLDTNGDYCVEATGPSVHQIFNCNINALTTAAFRITDYVSNINVYNSFTNIAAAGFSLFSMTTGNLRFNDCVLANEGSSTTLPTLSDGFVTMYNVLCEMPLGCTGTGAYLLSACIFGTELVPYINRTWLTTAGTATTNIHDTEFYSGTASAISIGAGTTVLATNVVIDSSNANTITGAGTLEYSPLAFSNSSTGVNVTTQIPIPIGPRISVVGGCEMLSGTGSPSGTITAPQGSLYLRTDGSAVNNRAYINTDGATTWTAITTVA